MDLTQNGTPTGQTGGKNSNNFMNINEIGQIAHAINLNNGWEVFGPHSFPESRNLVLNPEAVDEEKRVRFLLTHMALVHSEVSEATEAVRHRDRANFDEELADVVIRVASPEMSHAGWALTTETLYGLEN